MARKRRWWEPILDFLSWEASSMVKDVEKGVSKAVKAAEVEIEHATVKAIKASTVFILIFIGLIFALVGLSQYITMSFMLDRGVGYILVGVGLILLGWFAKAVR